MQEICLSLASVIILLIAFGFLWAGAFFFGRASGFRASHKLVSQYLQEIRRLAAR